MLADSKENNSESPNPQSNLIKKDFTQTEIGYHHPQRLINKYICIINKYICIYLGFMYSYSAV